MRIIGGSFKRRIIQFPKTKKTRPMMDRIKETVFNILGGAPEGAWVLDLFAGSGSLGLEALSRGAAIVYFVDSEEGPCSVIRKNLQSLGIRRDQTKIYQMAVIQALRRIHKQGLKFDLIFLDPPFNKGFIKKVLRLIECFDIVKPFGKIIYQRSPHEELPEKLASFQSAQERVIGQAMIGFLIAGEKAGNSKT
ncbi:MAG: 16S rRNA (guanine(966)-N(2))-methyltransferase RsmD [Candidatus Omnitrophica bacterium]|nr:16S rRNA (guanine(966)-N(2))-methyltransferase RsmD [Candidatus Omnitrophota bacterium]